MKHKSQAPEKAGSRAVRIRRRHSEGPRFHQQDEESPPPQQPNTGDPFASQLRAGSSLRLKNGYAQDDATPISKLRQHQKTTVSCVIDVADRLHSAAIHLLRLVRKQDAATGEGPARLSALSVLVFGGPKTLKELAAAEQVKPPTMSRIVDGLERSGLVNVSTDPEDSRRMNIRATAKGTRMLQKARQMRISELASLLESLTAEELANLSLAAETIRKALMRRD